MKFSLKSSLKALLACAMMLQVGVISAKAEDAVKIDGSKIANLTIESKSDTFTGNIESSFAKTLLYDGDLTGRWECNYQPMSGDGSVKVPVEFTFALDGAYNISKVTLVTGSLSGVNKDGITNQNIGAPTEYSVSTSMNGTDWTTEQTQTVDQSDYTVEDNHQTTLELSAPQETKFVKITIKHTTRSASNEVDTFIQLTEMELYGTASATVDKSTLQALYDQAAAITAQGFYTDDSWTTFTDARTAADTVLKNDAATRDEVDNAKNALQSAMNGLTETPINKIANTNITSVEANQADDGNDPNTLNDGNTANRWQTPYYPFETERMPVVFTLTLNSEYKVGKVSLYTNNSNTGAPLNYQVETSTDNSTWNPAHSVTFEQANIPASGYTPLSIRFEPENAKYVRVTVLHTSATTSNPVDTFLQLTEIEVFGDLDKTNLVNEITKAETEAAKTTVYTAVSIAALQTVIDTAKLLKDNGDATAEQVTAQITALENAIKALVRLADKTALKAKIDEVKALDTTGKTPNSVSALHDAITAAEAVYNDAQALQAAADEQVTKLTEAVAKLVDKANTAALTAAITAAEAEVAKTDTYTEASINAVNAIIAEATTLKNNENATQAAVDAEVTKLNDAVAAMDKIGETVDKTPLTDLIAIAKTEVAKTDVYTAESLAALQQAIDVAEAAVDTVDSGVAVQEQVDLLQAAIDALEEKGNTPDPTPVDKSGLVTAINDAKAEAAKTDVYTEESIAVLQQAIDVAEAVNADEDATEADVIAAIEAINDAVGALEEKGNTPDPTPVDKSDLVTAINDAKAEAAKTDVYTEESLAALQEAIDAAEAVNADENATEADVTAAIEAINEAVKALVEADDPTPVDPKPEDPKPEDPKPEDPTPETPKESFSATDKVTNVHVSAQAGVVDPNAELVVTPVTAVNANDKIATALKSLGGKQLAYDITLLLNNAEIQPNGMLQITLNIPKGFFNSSFRPKLYHISDDGKITPVELTSGAMLADGSGWVQFYTDHLSVYVLVSEANEVIKPNQPIDKNPLAPSNPVKDTAANAATPNTGDNTMAMTYVMLLVCAGAFLVLSYKRKNDKA